MSEDVSKWYKEVKEIPKAKKGSIFEELIKQIYALPYGKRYQLLLNEMPKAKMDKERTAKNTYASLANYIKKHYEGKLKLRISGDNLYIEKLETTKKLSEKKKTI